MTYHIQFQIATLVVLFILVGITKVRQMSTSFSGKLYRNVLYISIAATILELLAKSMASAGNNMDSEVTIVFIRLFLVFSVMTYAVTLMFVVQDTLHNKKKFNRGFHIIGTPLLYGSALILILPIEFRVEEGELYTTGPAFVVCISVSFYYILAQLFWIIYKWKNMRSQTRFTVCSVLGVYLFATALNQMFAPVRFISVAYVVINIVLILNLSRSENQKDKTLDIFTRKAFEYYVTDLLDGGKPSYIVYVNIDELRVLNSSIGHNATKELFKELCRRLNQIQGGRVFRIDTYELACVYSDKDRNYRMYYNSLKHYLSEDYNVMGVDMKLNYNMVEIPVNDMRMGFRNIYDIMRKTMANSIKYNIPYTLLGAEQIRHKLNRDRIREAIVNALKNDRIEIWYQPVMDVRRSLYTSAEALIRIRDEDKNFISASDVIQVGEEFDLIDDLGAVTFKRVLSFMNQSQVCGREFKKIHVNLTMSQSGNVELYPMLSTMLSEYHIPGKCLDLELVETEGYFENQFVRENIENIAESGVTFSLDDYGKGYANLEAIMKLPFKAVKLDRTLVHSDTNNEKANIALTFVFDMARQLGMQVVAKGVESRDDYERMKELGIRYMQGNYISPPLSEKDFLKIVQKPLQTR
ncbi:MAG: GGDEF domain-containing protein [Lachnospiraceae bacterium]|nr:GGDEF domain-containing protein [Lachnospiraceae bacterium]